MNQIIIFVIGAGVGGIAVWLAMKNPEGKPLTGLMKKQAEEKETNKKKIIALFESRDSISNNDVESGLNVSDATVERYLQELEREGQIRQVGKTGQSVYYSKI